MTLSTSTTTTVTREHRIELYASSICAIVNAKLASEGELRVPASASITITVPGGADWSNTDLDLHDQPVVITWSTQEKESS